MDAGYWRDLLDPAYGGGRRWLLLPAVLAAATGVVSWLGERGAAQPYIVAGARGEGPVPESGFAGAEILGTGGTTPMENIREFYTALDRLPAEITARIDAWDPDRSARALGPFHMRAGTVAGRPTYGARPAAWEVLEDKAEQGALWTAADVRQAPYEVVPATRQALTAAAGRLDRGAGTVWAGDNRQGWYGGADGLRVVAAGEAGRSAPFFTARFGRVRVMPYLEGIPCSIHGMVFAAAVIALRPVEILSLRVPGGDRITYAGTATFWDAPAPDRAKMRGVAVRVGRQIRDHAGFRGLFTVDGVLTADGFLPTELNARPGAGIAALTGGIEDLAPIALNRAVVAGEPLDYRPADLEELIVSGADRSPRGGGHVLVAGTVNEPAECRLAVTATGLVEVAPDDDSDLVVSVAPMPEGAAVAVRLDPERTPRGEPAAPRVAAALRHADERWHLGLGPVAAARPAR